MSLSAIELERPDGAGDHRGLVGGRGRERVVRRPQGARAGLARRCRPRKVTALIGPSGCGKSTFLRILNRMHELVPGAALAGEVLLDGVGHLRPGAAGRPTRAGAIGMVFQKPNPFPAMSIRDNVLAGLQARRHQGAPTATRWSRSRLTRAGLWNEVKDRLKQPGGALSGGQQQRLCIARVARGAARGAADGRAVLRARPDLDPRASRRRSREIARRRHDRDRHPQHAAGPARLRPVRVLPGRRGHAGRASSSTARPSTIFDSPEDERTADYVNGRFG